jgi:phosphoglycolate phosphatase
MKSTELRLIVCDWNGTVVDDAQRGMASTNAVLQQFDLPEQDLRSFRASFRLPLAQYFAALGVPASFVSDAVRIWNNELARHPARLRPGVEAFLERAAAGSASVGVVSAARRSVVSADAKKLGVLHRLEFVRGDVTAKVDVLRELVAASDGQVAYIGDTEYDIRAASEAGAVPFGIAGGYRPAPALRKAGAKVVARSFSALADELLLSVDGRTRS